METGVISSLDPHSKHNIIHGTLNVSIPLPPPYKRKIWAYKTAKTEQMHADLQSVNWHDLFLNLNVSEKGIVFADIFLDTVAKHISNKMITCNDKDAPWITSEVKTAIKEVRIQTIEIKYAKYEIQQTNLLRKLRSHITLILVINFPIL